MYSRESVLNNYGLLSHPDLYVRNQANHFLIKVIQSDQIWIIAPQIITSSSSANQKLLGAQLLYQKIEDNIDQLGLQQLQSLRGFIFHQLIDATYSLAVVRKLASAASLVASCLLLDHWPCLITDVVNFMQASPLQFRNGLIFLQRLPEQLRKTNKIKNAVKIKIRQRIFEQSYLTGSVFLQGLSFQQYSMVRLSLEALQNWITMGLPLLKLQKLLQKIIELSNFTLDFETNSLMEECFNIICRGLHYCSQQKCYTLDQIQFSQQRQRYSSQEISSLTMVIHFMQSKIPIFLALLGEAKQVNQIEIYISLAKEIILSYGFLMMEQVGYGLIELINKTLSCRNLKLSYFTFDFWLALGQKMMKCNQNAELDGCFGQIIDNLLDIVFCKTIYQSQSMLFQTSKEDTIDDINFISFDQYRKDAQNIIKLYYCYFTHKKKQEGSASFFKKLSDYIQSDSKRQGMELAIYAIKSIITQIVHDCDQQNVVNFILYLINQISASNEIPNKLIQQSISLIQKGSSVFMKNNHNLLIKCVEFSLGYIEDDTYKDNAFQCFEKLMEIVDVFENETIIEDLLNFYQSNSIKQPIISNKIQQAIVSLIVRLKDKNKITNYLNRLITRFETKSTNILGQFNDEVLLDQIRTLLDSYFSFPLQHKQLYLPMFIKISINAIAIVHKIIFDALNKKVKRQFGSLLLCIMTTKTALRLSEQISAEYMPVSDYIQLMNLIVKIFETDDFCFFLQYAEILQIFHYVLIKFRNTQTIVMDQWLRQYLPSINRFFINYAKENRGNINTTDPDIITNCFAIQQSVIIYDQLLYLRQPQRQDIVNLALMSIQYLNQPNLHRRVLSFLALCVAIKETDTGQQTSILQTIFISLPYFNRACYYDLNKIIICLLGKTDLSITQGICFQTLQKEPYRQIVDNVRETISKFFAFALQTHVQKYIIRVIADIAEIGLSKTSIDKALELQLKYDSYKKEFYNQQNQASNDFNRVY